MNRPLSNNRNTRIKSLEVQRNPIDDTGDKTAWDLYNNKAKINDGELVKDWNENLANLLIFAALFSAILTAFIIESMKLLQEDPQQTTNNLLLFMTMQAVNATKQNTTVAAYIPPSFMVETYVVVVNCLFFSSLSLSLLAALASIIILQWVGRYDTGILGYSAAKDRALHRQFRYDGVKRWRMNDIVSMLPYLLYLSLCFFFVGMIVWLFHTNQTVSIVILIFFLIGVVAYAITTIISVVSPSAPFRTPISDLFITILFRESSKKREEKEIQANKGFPLHTLMALLETIEIVSHSYSTLSTVAREVVRQPFQQVFRSKELVFNDRWKNIFQAVLSSFGGDVQRQEEEQDGLIKESLADYTVSLLVGEAPHAHEKIESLLKISHSEERIEYLNKILQRRSSSQTLVHETTSLSPIFIYSLVLNMWTPSVDHQLEDDILDWLSDTMDIPSDRLVETPLPSETAIQSYLTAVGVLICSKTKKKGLVTGVITSIEEFSDIVASATESYAGIYSRGIFENLRKLVLYNCALIARTKDSYTASKIVEDVGFLMIPYVQTISARFPTYELLFASSQCGYLDNESFQRTLEKLFEAESEQGGNVGLRVLLFLDKKLLSNSHWYPRSVTEANARQWLVDPLFGNDWGWILPSTYTPEELEMAKDIKDPALRLIASASSGVILSTNLAVCQDALFKAAAAYWVARFLWVPPERSLPTDAIALLQRLLTDADTRNGLMRRIPGVAGLYRDEVGITRYLQGFEFSFQRFDQLLSSCDAQTLGYLITTSPKLTHHVTQIAKTPEMMLRILNLIEGSQRQSLPFAKYLFQSFMLVILKLDDVALIKAACVLWADLLSHGAHDAHPMGYKEARNTVDLIKKLHSLHESSSDDAWARETFSRVLLRQRLLREEYLEVESSGIWDWHLDLGFERQVASAPEAIWSQWVADVKGI